MQHQDSDDDDPGRQAELTAVATVPAVLNAETMPVKTNGAASAGGWGLYSNGHVEATVNFPAAGAYQIAVVAKGDVCGGVWPRAEVRINQVAVGSFTAGTSSYATYSVVATVPSAGAHRVAVAFINDARTSTCDRNLYVDTVAITSRSSTPPAAPACNDGAVSTSGTGKKIFVATGGSDANDGTETRPFKTLTRASQAAGPGSVITFAAGIYSLTRSQRVSAKGTAAQPVIIRSAPGAKVILDGAPLGTWIDPIVVEDAAYVVIDGIEIRNSDGHGVAIKRSHHVTVQHCSIHDILHDAVITSGDDVSIVDNEMYNLVLSNKGGIMRGGWSCGVKSWSEDGSGLAHNFVVSGNDIHDVWGECVDALFVDGATIRGNKIHDCYSMSVYVDHARNVTIDGNYIFANSDAYNRRDNGKRAQGIGLSVEPYSSSYPAPMALSNITITNNLIAGTNNGIQYWFGVYSAQNTYSNLRILNNTFVHLRGNVLAIDPVKGGGVASGALFANNIALGPVYVGDPAAWTFTNNNFGTAGVPTSVRGSGNMAVDSKFVSPGGPGTDAFGYRLQASSPLVGKAQPRSEVPRDYACSPRDGVSPTIGFLEPR